MTLTELLNVLQGCEAEHGDMPTLVYSELSEHEYELDADSIKIDDEHYDQPTLVIAVL